MDSLGEKMKILIHRLEILTKSDLKATQIKLGLQRQYFHSSTSKSQISNVVLITVWSLACQEAVLPQQPLWVKAIPICLTLVVMELVKEEWQTLLASPIFMDPSNNQLSKWSTLGEETTTTSLASFSTSLSKKLTSKLQP